MKNICTCPFHLSHNKIKNDDNQQETNSQNKQSNLWNSSSFILIMATITLKGISQINGEGSLSMGMNCDG